MNIAFARYTMILGLIVLLSAHQDSFGKELKNPDRLSNGKLVPTESTWYSPKVSAEATVPKEKRTMMLAKKKDHSKDRSSKKAKHK